MRAPRSEGFGRAALVLIVRERLMIAVVVSGHGRGVRTPGRMRHRADAEARRDDTVRVAADHIGRYDLFGGEEDVFAGQAGLPCDAEVAPRMRVAVLVRALNVDDGDIGGDG